MKYHKLPINKWTNKPKRQFSKSQNGYPSLINLDNKCQRDVARKEPLSTVGGAAN